MKNANSWLLRASERALKLPAVSRLRSELYVSVRTSLSSRGAEICRRRRRRRRIIRSDSRVNQRRRRAKVAATPRAAAVAGGGPSRSPPRARPRRGEARRPGPGFRRRAPCRPPTNALARRSRVRVAAAAAAAAARRRLSQSDPAVSSIVALTPRLNDSTSTR